MYKEEKNLCMAIEGDARDKQIKSFISKLYTTAYCNKEMLSL